MAISFPTGLDTSFGVPSTPSTTPLSSAGDSSPARTHSQHHADLGSAVVLLENRVGIDGSADTNSVQYKLARVVRTDATSAIADSVNITLGTSVGTKIGTGTGQLLGFLNATPVSQQANSVDLGSVLSNFGFRASGGNPPLNLGTGQLTAGVGIFSGHVRANGAADLAGLTVVPGATGTIGAVIKGIASQSVSLLEVQHSNGTPYMKIPGESAAGAGSLQMSGTGYGYHYNGFDSAARTYVNSDGATSVLVRLKGAGSQSGDFIDVQDNSANHLFQVLASGQIKVAASANEATGAGSAALGANSPAVTNTAPYKWLKFTSSDGSQVYVPAWK